MWGLQPFYGCCLLRVRFYLSIFQHKPQKLQFSQPQKYLCSACLEICRLQHCEHLFAICCAVHVRHASSGEVIDKLSYDACQPRCLDDCMHCSLEGRGSISQAKRQPEPHVQGFGGTNAGERDAVLLHRNLPEATCQIQFIKNVEWRDLG